MLDESSGKVVEDSFAQDSYLDLNYEESEQMDGHYEFQNEMMDVQQDLEDMLRQIRVNESPEQPRLSYRSSVHQQEMLEPELP